MRTSLKPSKRFLSATAAIAVVVGLSLALAVACKGVPKLARVPKTPDIIIKADVAYLEGEEQQLDLALKHYKSLEEIVLETRKVFPVKQFEFFERQVGFFRNPTRLGGSNLGLRAYTDETFDTATTSRNKRIATVFFKYVQPLLEIMVVQEEVMEEPKLYALNIYLTYWKKNKAKELYGKGQAEWVEFFFLKEDVYQYLSRGITDQALLDNSYVFTELGIVEVSIRGEPHERRLYGSGRGITESEPRRPIRKRSVVAQDYAKPADESAMRELSQKKWVRDLYVSPGHMNVGVFREEKDWNSPMIGKWVCTVLAQHGSKLTWVRFVDFREVVYKGKSPRGAEISKFKCR